MATVKQKLALENIVENHGNIGKAMKNAGYSDNTAKNPKNLTESKGYQSLLESCGLTRNFVISALVEDIRNKPQNRGRELAIAIDLLGLNDIDPEKDDKLVINVTNFRTRK